jgi:hypothetical protein
MSSWGDFRGRSAHQCVSLRRVRRRKCCPLMSIDLTDLFVQTEIDPRFSPRTQICTSSQVRPRDIGVVASRC